MIYTKKANFPYPVLMNFTDDYLDSEFELDITIRDNTDEYAVDITWKVSSDFIKGLLKTGKADLILIIKSKDNQFHKLSNVRRPQVLIPKKKLCINARTVMQLMIQVNEDISFEQNHDLNSFYDDVKSEIFVAAGNVLGFSNTVIFDGRQNKPFELFEKKIDKDIKSDVEIRLGTETILIVYKKEDYQFVGIQGSKEFNYPYIYMGLQKALISFLLHANTENPEEGIQVDEMEPPENPLESKLYSLMQAKNITELSMENLDEVVYQISDNLLMKYHDAVRGLRSAN